MPVAAVILAAGMGTRMKSDTAKVLHPLAGVPLVQYPVDLALKLKADRVVVVVGHQRQQVEAQLAHYDKKRVTTAVQTEQLGTGHAVLSAESALKGFDGEIVILSGDVPLLEPATIRRLLAAKQKAKSPFAMITAKLSDPFGYGRVLRDGAGRIEAVIEEKDASPAQRQIDEANMGIYAADARFLFSNLKRIGSDNKQGEYYLPDLVMLANADNKLVASVTAEALECSGINNRMQLAQLEAELFERIAVRHMLAGVTLLDPKSARISPLARIGRDCVIGPNVELRGAVKLGKACIVETGSIIENSTLAEGVHVKPYCIIEDTRIDAEAIMGPFAHTRPFSHIGAGCHVGNFVETKKSTLKPGAKANHLSYIGDAVIGKKTNVGAGTITCNYDGYGKYKTTVGDEVLIGSDTQLIAPVSVPDRVVLGAGTSLTGKVKAKPGDLIVTRSEAVVIANYRERLMARHPDKVNKDDAAKPAEKAKKKATKKAARKTKAAKKS